MRKTFFVHGLLTVFVFVQVFGYALRASAMIGDIREAKPGQRKTFTMSPKEYSKIEDAVEVPNMPRVRSQDALGVCYAFAATTVMQHALCQKNGWDCQNLKPEQEISDAGMMMDAIDQQGVRYFQNVGSSGTQAVSTFQKFPIITNKCAPFDVIVNKSEDPAVAARMQDQMWDRLWDAREKTWNAWKVDDCKECAKQIAVTAIENEEKNGNLKFNSSRTQVEKLKAFTRESGEKMMEQLLVPERCRKEETMPQTLGDLKWKPVPPDGASAEDDFVINSVKEHFKNKKTPMMLGVGIIDDCPDKPKKLCRLGGHEIVVSGYRKACNPQGKCIEEFKVHNSWGQRWQEQNNDGWLDARALLSPSRAQLESYE